MKYRKKPCEVEAVQWGGANNDQMNEFAHDDGGACFATGGGLYAELWCASRDDWIVVDKGDWVVKSDKGFYHVPEDEFIESYEPIT